MKQLDYIKIKIENIEILDTQYLTEHPTIKNRYKMKFPIDEYGNTFYGNNIDIYHSNNCLYLSTSIPFLMYNHNFVDITPSQCLSALEYLSKLLNVDLMSGIVIDFEVALIQTCDFDFVKLANSISGISNMDMQKRTRSFLSYGNKNMQLKIYNVKSNLKKKVPKQLLSTLTNLTSLIVKFELKFKNDKRYKVDEFIEYGISDNLLFLELILRERIHLVCTSYGENKFDDMLYKALLTANMYTKKHVDEIVHNIINSSDLSHIQKTRRRNSLRRKQIKAKHAGKTSLMDLLKDPCCDDLPF